MKVAKCIYGRGPVAYRSKVWCESKIDKLRAYPLMIIFFILVCMIEFCYDYRRYTTVFLSILIVFSEGLGQSIEKPNIIFILADDLSYRDLSCFGQEHYTTPHLDHLAATGIRFSQAYAGAPECAPSRGTLLSGLHAGHGPIRLNRSARGQDFIPDSIITVAELLRSAGYTTGFVGKWGVGLPGTEGAPENQGFDYAFGFYDQMRAHTYFPLYLMENGKRVSYTGNEGFDMQRRYAMNRGDTLLLNQYNSQGQLILSELADPAGAIYSQDEIDQSAFQFLKESKSNKNPFFLYYATQLPHGPLIIDDLGRMNDNLVLPQRQKEWAAMVQRLDAFVGALVDYLKQTDEYKRTVIFFASDNGYSMCGYMGRGNNASNWPDDPILKNKGPFRGGKFSALEGGSRIPFFVSAPAFFKPKIIQKPVWLIDFYATAAELSGVRINHRTDGQSLVPLLSGHGTKDFDDRPLYFYKDRAQSVRMGAWKAYRADPESPVQLYLIEEDIHSDRDLSAFYPKVVREMVDIMEQEHEPHPWYWNPWETNMEYKAKIQRAKETGNMQEATRPNGL